MQRATSSSSSRRGSATRTPGSRAKDRGESAEKARAKSEPSASRGSTSKIGGTKKARSPAKASTSAGAGADTPANKEPQRRKKSKTARRRSGRQAKPDPSRILWQRLVNVMPDAVVTLKTTKAIGHWSVGASRITGRRRREVQRRGFASVFKDADECARLLGDLESRGRVTDREVTLLNAAAEDVPVRVFATRLKGVDGRSGTRRARRHKRAGSREATAPDAERYLLVLHDMTEVHRIRSRLIETEKLSAMAKIAGSVAHEFRNPLNALFLNTDLLEDELTGHTEVEEAIAPTLVAIREEIERLNQIITHYLSLSKIASGQLEVMDLGEAVQDFVAEWHERAEQRDVTLRVRPDDETHPISADPNQVRRVLVNLVDNALDAVGGPSVDGDDRARRGRVTLLLRRMRRSVKVTVKDNGPGIPGDLRERVFEPFFTSKSGGSGLGLYLVREIVLASGGTVSLSSADGRGTSISVRWPLAEDAPRESARS